MLSSTKRNDFIAPGPLSVHHAQLVAGGDDQARRCASCHAAGNQSFAEWVHHLTDPTLAAPPQSELCLNCHDKEIPRDTALLAHGIAGSALFATDNQNAGHRLVDPRRSFACSTCHREHHGTNFDLKAMSNSACQACHRHQYHSFATNHPDFGKWPEVRRTRIAFDHRAHQTKHFPTEKQEFACRDCHQLIEGGFQQTLSYQVSCARCHDGDIQTSWKSGIDLVSLPMVDIDSLEGAGHELERWPAAATGDFDGALPLLTRLLLLSDPEAASSFGQLGIDFDFFDIDPDDEEQATAAATILRELTQFAEELAERGHDAIKARISEVIARELSVAELVTAVAHLSPDNMAAPSVKWLAGTEATATDSFEAPVTAGGWLRDDAVFSLRYLPMGHDDPFVATWIDFLTAATRGPQAELAEALVGEMMKPTAAGMCGSCHSVDRDPQGGLVVNWLAKQPDSATSFTVFSHAPHVLQTQLADCAACHSFAQTADMMATYRQTNPTDFVAGFNALTRQECATCHKAGAAGDSCTQCHKYHVSMQPSP